MKEKIQFFKENTLAGLAIIIPIALVLVVLSDIITAIFEFVKPYAQSIPFGMPIVRNLIALFVIICIGSGILFFVGLFLKSYIGSRFTNLIENKFFNKIPFYSTIKNMTSQLTGAENIENPAVEIDIYNNGVKKYGIIMEKLEDGRFVVFTPFIPMISLGEVFIVEKEQIKVLKVSLPRIMNVLANYGIDSKSIYVNTNKNNKT